MWLWRFIGGSGTFYFSHVKNSVIVCFRTIFYETYTGFQNVTIIARMGFSLVTKRICSEYYVHLCGENNRSLVTTDKKHIHIYMYT